MSDVILDSFNHLIADDGPIALTLRRDLEPAEGKGAWIFPPTFAGDDGADDDESGGGKYCIDRWEEPAAEMGLPPMKRNTCLISSVGSQANFIEPIFKRDRYKSLVPQHEVKFKDGSVVNLLDAGHRAADASFRFSMELGKRLWSAFNSIKAKRDYSEMIRLAPTSLIFGSWDSRGTGAKCQRIVRSVIRAYDVIEAKRSAIYNPPIDYVDRDLLNSTLDKGKGTENPLSQEGFKHSPASGSHGGVRVTGNLQIEAALNLVVLRSLSSDIKHRRYLLALALVALTYEDSTAFNLREGCLLRPSSASCVWNVVSIDKSKDTTLTISHEQAIAYAKLCTDEEQFKVAQPASSAEFDTATAEAWVAKPKKERKKLAKKGHPSEMTKSDDSTDPISDLRTLVESLEPTGKDEFSTGKTKPLQKLQTRVDEIESGPAVEGLKTLAASLKPLLISGAGAAARKKQMLALFPATGNASTSEQTNQLGAVSQ